MPNIDDLCINNEISVNVIENNAKNLLRYLTLGSELTV